MNRQTDQKNNPDGASVKTRNSGVQLWQKGAAVKITTGELTGTIAREGVVATLGGAGMTPEEIKHEMHIAREISPDGQIGVNLMYVAKEFHASAVAAQECGANFIVLSAGYDSQILNHTGEYSDIKLEIIPKVAHPTLAQRILQSGVVKRIVLEGSGCGGHIGFDSIKNFVTTKDLVARTVARLSRYIAVHALGKNAPEAEIEAFIADLLKNKAEYRKKYKFPELIAAGGINEDNFQGIIDAGADHIGNCLIYTISKESNAHANWKEMQFAADSRIFFESPVKGMIGSAIKNSFIEKYFDLDDTGIYRYSATVKRNLERGTSLKTEFTDRCNVECMANNFCLKYVKEYRHPVCIFFRLEETAVYGRVDDGIVFTSENVGHIRKFGRPNMPVKEVIDHIKRYTYGA